MVATNEIFTKKVRPLGVFKYTLLELLETLKKLVLWVLDLLLSMILSLANFIKLIGVGLVKIVVGIFKFFKKKCHEFRYNDLWGRLSYIWFGASSFGHKQYVNGCLYTLFEIGYIVVFALFGVPSIAYLSHLGEKEFKPATIFEPAQEGDNSILILIFGLLWVLSILVFLYIWNRSIESGYNNYRIVNFAHYEKVINRQKEVAARINDQALTSFDGKIYKWQFNNLIKHEIEVQTAAEETKSDKKYVVYLLKNIVSHAYKYKRTLKRRVAAAEKAQLKYEKFVADRAARDRLLVEKCEQEKAMQIAKYDTLIKIAANDVDRENAIYKRDNELPLQLEKIDVVLEKFRNKTLRGTSNLNNKLKKKNHLVNELQKRYTNYVEWQSTRNNDKFGKFNRYFKRVAELDGELLFYRNYNVFKDIYQKSLDGAEAANEANRQRAIDLLNERNAKIEATNNKFATIYARKAEFEERIKGLKDEYDQKVADIKARGGSEDEIREAKAVLIEETTRLSNAARDLPSDKSIKGLYKEEIKETKSAYKRDKKYIKVNYTPESYAKEKVIDEMLIEYKIAYKDAVYFASCLLDKETGTFLSEETVNSKINQLENEKADYEAAHPDKYEGRPKSFRETLSGLFNENFHITILLFPILGIVMLSIVPLLFSIVVAFTNYSRGHIPPTQLFTWVGFANFETLFSGQGQYAALPQALLKTLGWTFLWAFSATFSNYILGIIVALMINKKGIVLKKLWRTVFVMTIAVPQFISLLSIAALLSKNGAIDMLLGGNSALGFKTNADITKLIIILVNIWVGIPYTILSTTGILLNIPEDLYESARVDGAGTLKQFTKITMPYILFVTGPYLITQFVGNFNNFNVIYFLSNGEPKIAGAVLSVGETDILITFLYKLITSASNPQFGIASSVGIIIFMICAFVSIVMYNKTGAIKEEDQFQ